MTTTYGLTLTGFLPKTQDTCRQEMTASIQKLRGASVDCSDGSLEGQWIGIFSEREAVIWDLGQQLYSSIDPDAATGTAQDAVCAITGTRRASALSSTTVETLTGNPTTSVGQGSQIKTTSTAAVFATQSTAVIASVAAWQTGHAYANARAGTTLGDRVTNGGNVYECITAGTSAGGGGPLTTAADITDNTAHWRYLGAGTGAVDVLAASLVKDAIVAVSGDLNVINTPVGGWSGAINMLDAALGNVVQADGPLRVTREAELAQSGAGPADALRAKILNVAGVTSCTVFHNDTNLTDGNGQPAHTVQVLVEGGDNTAIATVLKNNVVGGILTFGTTTVIINDSQGTPQTMKFTRPSTVTIYVDVTLTYNPASASQGGYPSDGDAEVQAAIAKFGTGMSAGRDVVASSLAAAVFSVFVNGVQVAGVQGVLDVTLVKIGTSASPTLSTTIVITPFQKAAFDTSRVTVHSSAGSL